MEEIVSINDGRHAMKGSIQGCIIQVGELKSGTKPDGGDWTRKEFLIEDKSGSVKLTAWGEDVQKFKIGTVYEIVNPQWKLYKDEAHISPSKFGSIKEIGPREQPQESPMESAQLKTADNKRELLKVPELSEEQEVIIENDAIALYQIKKKVEATINCYENNPNQGMIWKMTEKIYERHFTAVFKKASEK